MQISPILWLAAAVGFLALEASTFNMTSIWFAIGSAAALLCCVFTGSFRVQAVVFLVVSILCLAAFRPLAAKLRRVLRVDSEGDTYFAQTDGRCPFLCADGLCELQRTLGEQSLCRTCRDFPRWEVLLSDRVEQGLSPACPEAARRRHGGTRPGTCAAGAAGAHGV